MTSKLTIGVLGGGQLARMLIEAAAPLDIAVVFLDQPNCPAAQISPDRMTVTGSFKDPERIRELARRCDVLTVEIEHVDAGVLNEISTEGIGMPDGSRKRVAVHPHPRTLRLIQDKYEQKEHFARCHLPVAPQMELNGGEEGLRAAGHAFGFPFMAKAKRDSYDGRGNFKVRSEADFAPALDALGQDRALYAEKWMPFVAELAVMVIRTEDETGLLRRTFAYPVVESVHEDSICSLVFMPPRNVSAEICSRARDLAEQTVASLWGRGVFGVEMFVMADGSLAVVEVAPRTHNSGHYTIEAVPYMSQFKAHIYSILDMVPDQLVLRPRVRQAVMINLLGGVGETHRRLVELAESSTFASDLDVYIHLYGKEARPNRKIGHITAVTDQTAPSIEMLARALIITAAQIRHERLVLLQCQEEEQQQQQQQKKQQQQGPLQQPSMPLQLPVDPNLTPTASGDPSSRNSEAPLPLVVVTMGSDSDLPVLKAGLDVLERFGVPFNCTITSAHRTPKEMVALARSAASRGIRVIIAAAGGAAHLPGMLASETPVPVIGVPVKASYLDGVDSLHSIVQMPRGVPVATVGINNSTNAALLAIRILGSQFPVYQEKMADYMRQMEAEVIAKRARLEEMGYVAYLANSLTKH